MKNYDGWAVKKPNGELHTKYYNQRKHFVIWEVERESPAWNWWRKLRRRGYKIVKVKLVEVK